MSFDPTDQELLCEVQEAEKLRDDHLRAIGPLIDEYAGRWYREQGHRTHDDPWSGDSNPDPFAYSFISNILPSLVYSNPDVNVKARRVVGHDRVAQAMRAGLKGLIIDVPWLEEFQLAVVDFLLFQGVLLHYLEDDTRWSDGAVRPNMKRVDFRHWGADSLASTYDEAEFAFHCFYAFKNELMLDPEVDVELLNSMSVNDEEKQKPHDTFPRGDRSKLKRGQVKLYSVWLREKNAIRVIAADKEGRQVFPEREWFGDADKGPYTLIRGYDVPGQLYPLSPLVAVWDQVRDLQKHSKAAARSAAGRKSVILVDTTSEDLPENIYNAEDREVIPVPGFSSSQVEQIELGGVTPQQYEYLSVLRERLDRHSGLNETARGNVGAADSATEASIAQQALNNRQEFLKQRTHAAAMESLGTFGWWLFHTEGVVIPVTTRDPMTGLESEGLFIGGVFEGEDAGSYADYQLEIQPYSMGRVSEQLLQRRAMEMAGVVLQYAQMMPLMPWVRWPQLLNMIGDAFNFPELHSLLMPELLGMQPHPELMPPSSVAGEEQKPAERYAQPGLGIGVPRGTAAPNAMEFNLNEQRAELNTDFGRMYGGTQGPPGSRRP